VNVTHVITSLDVGGAETMLVKLLSGIDPGRCTSRVVSLLPEGQVGGLIRALDIPVRSLDMRPGAPDPRGLVRLAGILRDDPPDVVQTWMYHADLVGGLAARFAGRVPVVWGIQNTVLEAEWSPLMSRATLRACARLSRRLPKRIVSCSQNAARAHVVAGYADDRMVVIPNGVDIEAFRPDVSARPRVRAMLGISEGAPLVGLVARFAREKDHETFAQAVGRVLRRVPDAHFVLCGAGVDDENLELVGWLDEAGSRSASHLLGARDDIVDLMPGLDVLVLSSITEAFPNVLGEAMASGIPCVTTDVGDARYIVGDTGRVVPPRSPDALADGLVELLTMHSDARRDLGIASRVRVVDEFSLASVVERYLGVYEEMAQATGMAR